MSADIWLEDEDGEQVVVDSDPDAAMRDLIPMRSSGEVTTTTFNLTYNLTPMLTEAGMPRWKDMIGLTAADAGEVWREVHDALVANPDHYRTLNPENGWGTYEDATRVIGALADACERFPTARVSGWL